MRKAQHAVGIQKGNGAHQCACSKCPSYNRGTYAAHTGNTPESPDSSDQGNCATGPTGHLLHTATFLRLGDIADLPHIRRLPKIYIYT